MIQGSEEWVAARVGSLGASRLADALARTKTGWGASRANLMAAIVAERLTGLPQDGYTNATMARGLEMEPEARAAYSFYSGNDVEEVGLILHPSIERSHASPDGLIGADGVLEIKCPNTATHIETLLGGSIPQKYLIQMSWQMACSGRQWADFVSYDPRLPEELRLFTQRIERDNEAITLLETAAQEFLDEVEAKLTAIRTKARR